MDLERLPPEEWHRLSAALSAEFGTRDLPDPKTCEVYASFDGGGLSCFFVMERVVHAGPFYVRPDLRGRGLARAMAEKALGLTGGAEGYICATRPEVEHLAKSLGLDYVVGTLWRKEK